MGTNEECLRKGPGSSARVGAHTGAQILSLKRNPGALKQPFPNAGITGSVSQMVILML